jgi:hypothetical protein
LYKYTYNYNCSYQSEKAGMTERDIRTGWMGKDGQEKEYRKGKARTDGGKKQVRKGK